MARAFRQEEQVTRWKTGKKESWIKLMEASKEASKKIDKVVQENTMVINQVVTKILAGGAVELLRVRKNSNRIV